MAGVFLDDVDPAELAADFCAEDVLFFDDALEPVFVVLVEVFLFVVVLRFVVLRRVLGPLARFSANNSCARSGVIWSTESSLRRVALVLPSVT